MWVQYQIICEVFVDWCLGGVGIIKILVYLVGVCVYDFWCMRIEDILYILVVVVIGVDVIMCVILILVIIECNDDIVILCFCKKVFIIKWVKSYLKFIIIVDLWLFFF